MLLTWVQFVANYMVLGTLPRISTELGISPE